MVWACDGGDRRLATALVNAFGQTRGILHAAGVVVDKLLRQMKARAAGVVLAAKTLVAAHLHGLHAQKTIETLVMYSSGVYYVEFVFWKCSVILSSALHESAHTQAVHTAAYPFLPVVFHFLYASTCNQKRSHSS